jgi:hypothetical protein
MVCSRLCLQALRVSVGQLGIIGRLKMKIVKEVPVRRLVASLPAWVCVSNFRHYSIAGMVDAMAITQLSYQQHNRQGLRALLCLSWF